MLAGKGDERLFVGGVLAGAGFLGGVGNFKAFEQDFAQLLWGVEIELGACQSMDGVLVARHFLVHQAGKLSQHAGIHAHAFDFHVNERGHQRSFDLVKDPFLGFFLELRFELSAQLPGAIGDLNRRIRLLRELPRIKTKFALRLRPATRGPRRVTQMGLAENIQGVAPVRLDQCMGQHHVKKPSAHE